MKKSLNGAWKVPERRGQPTCECAGDGEQGVVHQRVIGRVHQQQGYVHLGQEKGGAN